MIAGRQKVIAGGPKAIASKRRGRQDKRKSTIIKLYCTKLICRRQMQSLVDK